MGSTQCGATGERGRLGWTRQHTTTVPATLSVSNSHPLCAPHRWAKRSGTGGGGSGKRGKDGGEDGGGTFAMAAAGEGYSDQTRISLSNVDESLINTDLIEALVVNVLSNRQHGGGGGVGGGGEGKRRGGGGDDDASAILIFAPGACVLCLGGSWCACGSMGWRGCCTVQLRNAWPAASFAAMPSLSPACFKPPPLVRTPTACRCR